MDIHHWWRFRDGQVCFYRGTEDTAQTQDLLRRDYIWLRLPGLTPGRRHAAPRAVRPAGQPACSLP